MFDQPAPHRLLRALFLLPLACLPAVALGGESLPRAPIPWPLHDVDVEGALWVRGATYKARFGPEGATYIPFLGSQAPGNFPVHLHTASIHVGGESLGFDAEAPARREGGRIRFEREAFVERYDVGAQGLEQSFEFATLPTRGEIVVSIEVETELSGSTREAAIRFENQLGAVAYSQAFALDARGEKLALETRLRDGRIEIVVPAAFTARAELPLVIDPFLSTLLVDVDAGDDVNPDVAIETATLDALVVYEAAFSAGDHDVIAERWQSTLVPAGIVSIDISSADWRSPCVAYNRASQVWLCAAEVGTAPLRTISGRGVNAVSLFAGPPLLISAGAGSDHHDPDVGGDVTPGAVGSTDFLVVWQSNDTSGDTDVLGRLVNGSATGEATTITLVADGASTSHLNPSISKTNGSGTVIQRMWTIAFEAEVSFTNHDIHGRLVRSDGVILGGLFPIAVTSTDERDPAAAELLVDHGAGQRWLVAYEFGLDLRLAALAGTIVQDTLDITAPIPLGSLGEPDATMDGRLWQIAYRATTGIGALLDRGIRATSVSFAGGALSLAETPANVTATNFDETKPRIASSFGFATFPFRTLVAYQADSTLDASNIQAGVYNSPITAGDFAYCFGTSATCPCGNAGGNSGGCENSASTGGAVIAASGRWFVGGDTAVLNVTALPPGAPLLFFQGTAQIAAGAPLGDGLLCVNGTITRMAIKFSSGGAASFPEAGDPDLSVAGAVPAVGGWRYYQAWHRDSGSFCTPSLFNLTNGVALLWAP